MSVAKDANAVVLTEEIKQAIHRGGAVRMAVPLKDLRYGNNPRKKKGFDPESMRELAATIAADGLLKNVLVRQIPHPHDETMTLFEVVGGERRIRAIRSLVEEDRLVQDQESGRLLPASQVYCTVPALVQGRCDNKMATRLAFIENDQHVPLCDADVIDLCVTLETQENTRKEISELLGKSQAWLCHTLGFVSRLTPSNYEKLRSGEINRSVAVTLMNYDPEVQTPIIEAAKEIAVERHSVTKEKAQKEVVVADESVNRAVRDKLNVARNADPRIKQLADQKVESAKKKAAKAAERQLQVDRVVPTPSQSDVAEAAFQVIGTAHGNKNLNSAQIREHFIDKAKTLLAIGDDGDPIDIETGNFFVRRDLELSLKVADAISTGDRDFSAVLRDFYTSSGTWGAKVVPVTEEVDEDDDDDEEDSDFFASMNWDDVDPEPANTLVEFDLATIGNDDDD